MKNILVNLQSPKNKSFLFTYFQPFIILFAFIITFPPIYSSGIISLSSRLNFSQPNVIFALTVVLLIIFYQRQVNSTQSFIDLVTGVILSGLLTVINAVTAIEKVNTPQIQGFEYLTNGFVNIILSFAFFVGFTLVFSVVAQFIRTSFFQFQATTQKISWIKIWLFIMLIWALQIVWFLPGTTSFDALRQFSEYSHLYLPTLNFSYSFTNHQPWFTTLFFGTIFKIGSAIGGPNTGIFAITLVQFCFESLVYAHVTKFAFQRGSKFIGKLALFLYSGPVFAIYSQTIDKTSMYLALAALFTLIFVKTFTKLVSRDSIPPKQIIAFVTTGFALSLFRNDGAIISLTTSFVLITVGFIKHNSKKNIAKITINFFSLCILVLGWQKVVLPINNVIPSSPIEPLTLPLRQVTYTYQTSPNSFSKEDKKTLNRIIPLKQIRKSYNVNLGDMLKSHFTVDTFLNDSKQIKEVTSKKHHLNTRSSDKNAIAQFKHLWLKQFFKHPLGFLKVYFQGNSQYLSPFFNNVPGDSLFYDFTLFSKKSIAIIHPHWYPQYRYVFDGNIRNIFMNISKAILAFPPMALLINVATPLWLSLLCFGALISWKKIIYMFTLVPSILFWLVSTVSPVNGYSRYGLVATSTLIIVLTIMASLKSDTLKNK